MLFVEILGWVFLGHFLNSCLWLVTGGILAQIGRRTLADGILA
jgi:hypothetical protein